MELITRLLIMVISFLLCSSNMIKFNAACNPRDREALNNLQDFRYELSSWVGNDCCKWEGVICKNKTEGDVVKLELSGFWLSGELGSSLLELKHLYHLDLSWNSFTRIPAFLGSLQNLWYLDLSHNGLTGKVPPQLGNLSSLHYIDLSFNDLGGNIPRTLRNLCNLEVLDLSHNKLRREISSRLFTNSSRCSANKLKSLNLGYNLLSGRLPDELGTAKNLEELFLGGNSFSGSIPMSLGRLSMLRELDLSRNKLQGEILSRLFRNSSVNKMKSLNLEYNLLSEQLPGELGSLENLEMLSLRGNSFSGSIPTSLGRLSLLRVLDLRDNKLNGSLPESFGNLSSLQELRISNNMLEGDVTKAHFANLKKLYLLDISSMVLNLSSDWVPPFQLIEAQLQNCSVGHRLPEWLRTQKYVQIVNVSNAGISGSVPSWFWNMTSQLMHLDISYNQLEGNLSNMLLKSSDSGGEIHLNSNRFTGSLPLISSYVEVLDLSKNYLSGPISVLLCNPAEDMNSLQALDLSENQLSGMLPDCWSSWRSLALISLQSNNLTGNVPTSMGFLKQLRMLHLQKNSLNGTLPSSLQNCTQLRVIDLGENRLTGAIPTWIGERLGDTLIILRLHSNKFHGEIPRKLCYLIMLQIMDLGHNNLSGSIPKCFSNFSTMASNQYTKSFVYLNYTVTGDKNTVAFVAKGKDMVYEQSLLPLVVGIDLSSNNLNGEIPEELTYLFRLQTLNLADNSFTGGIPKRIGLLSSLESLDLSNNRLWGSIPQSLTNLTFLSYLNLSYNNLSGRIPSSTQLQSFPELSYTGNHDLCGFPLNKCDEDGQRQKTPNGDGEGSMDGDEDWIEMKWFYMGLPLGFVVGFWCLWGVLLVKKTWRYAYFRFLDDIIYSLYTCVKQKKK